MDKPYVVVVTIGDIEVLIEEFDALDGAIKFADVLEKKTYVSVRQRNEISGRSEGSKMWKKFSEIKPKDDGWFMTTIDTGDGGRYTMALYWYTGIQKFIDGIRDDMCQTYDVRSIFGQRIYDVGQDRTDSVVAWKEEDGPYMGSF